MADIPYMCKMKTFLSAYAHYLSRLVHFCTPKAENLHFFERKLAAQYKKFQINSYGLLSACPNDCSSTIFRAKFACQTKIKTCHIESKERYFSTIVRKKICCSKLSSLPYWAHCFQKRTNTKTSNKSAPLRAFSANFSAETILTNGIS